MRITASKHALWKACRHWAQEGIPWTDTGPKDARNFGLAMHDYIEAKTKGDVDILAIASQRDLTQEQFENFALLTESWDANVEVPGVALAEPAFAYNPITGAGRMLGASIGRAYKESGLKDDEIGGSADLVWMQEIDGKRFVVLPDLKTGFQAHLREAAWNDQMLLLALMAIKATKAEGARVIIHKLDFDGVTTSHHDVDLTEASVIEADLRAEVEAFQRGEHWPQPGPHCKALWCPAVASCAAAGTAMERVIEDKALVPAYRMLGPIATPNEARYRLQLLPMLKAAVKAFEAGIEEYADQHGGIETDAGVWGAITTKSKSLVANAAAMAVLEEELGVDGANLASEMSISAASIERAVKAKGIRPIKPTVERIVANLAKRGAVKHGERTTYEVRKASAKGNAA